MLRPASGDRIGCGRADQPIAYAVQSDREDAINILDLRISDSLKTSAQAAYIGPSRDGASPREAA